MRFARAAQDKRMDKRMSIQGVQKFWGYGGNGAPPLQ